MRGRSSFDEIAPISYDYLVFALGAEVNFFGTAGAPDHAFPMYTLPHAVHLKDHLLERWEAADRDPSLLADGALNVVVVGGGPTGVETAGALAELYRGDFAKDYPGVEPEDARVTLVEAGPELFGMFKPKLRDYAAAGAHEAGRGGEDGRSRRVGDTDHSHAEVGRDAQGAHARLGRGPAGEPARPVARARASAW